MRRLIGLVVTAALVACGGGSGPSREQTLHASVISDPKSFNVVTAREVSTSDIMGLVFEGLVRSDPKTFEILPNLADTWSVAPDGTHWTFHLRQDVHWSDGVLLTADDVMYSFQKLYLDTNVASGAPDLLQIDGKLFTIEKNDTWTVTFFTHEPFAPFLRSIGFGILPAHRYGSIADFNQALGINTPAAEIVGTGPFMLSEFKPGERVVLVANPNYWMKDEEGKALPRLAKILIHIVPDLDAEAEWFKAGKTDYIGVRGKDWPVLAQNSAGFKLWNLGPRFISQFVFFNHNLAGKIPDKKKAWFRDREFRTAIAWAIDRQTIVDGIYNSLAFEQHSCVPDANKVFYDSGVFRYPYDLQRAADILKQAGYARGADGKLRDKSGNIVAFELITNAENNERVKTASVIKESLAQLGIDVHVNAMAFNALVDRLDNDLDWEAAMLGFTASIDPNNGANLWRVEGDLHMFNQKPRKPPEDAPVQARRDWQNAVAKWKQGIQPWEREIEELINTGAKTIDPAARWQIYSRIQRIVSREVPFVYTVAPAALYATRDQLKNVDPSPAGSTSMSAVLHNVERLSRE